MPQDNAELIRDLTEQRQSGVSSTSADGHSVSVDQDTIKQTLRDAKLNDAGSIAAGNVKPPLVSFGMGGAW